MPIRILTPLGCWKFASSGSFAHLSPWSQMRETIKNPLGLKLFKPEEKTETGIVGPFWAITKWKEKNIEWPAFREPTRMIPPREGKGTLEAVCCPA